MPFVPSNEIGQHVNAELDAAMYTPEQYQKEQTALNDGTDFSNVMSAAIDTHNIAASYQSKWMHWPGQDTKEERQAFADGTFDMFEAVPEEYRKNPVYMKEYAQYGTSQRKVDWVTNNIDRQENNRKAIDKNIVSGMAASVIATITSPEQLPAIFFPAGLALKSSSTAGRLTLSQAVTYEAGIAGSFAALGEVGLHETQPTRTKEESMYAIGGSVLFSSLLVSVIGMATGRAGRSLKQLDDDMVNIDSNPSITSVGAEEAKIKIPDELEKQAVRQIDKKITDGEIELKDREIALQFERKMLSDTLSQVKHPKLMRVLGYAHPSVRIATARIASARALGEQLVSDPLTRTRHLYGETLGPAIETSIDQFKYEISHKIENILQSQYVRYVEETKKAGEKKLSFDQFSQLVGKANRADDISDITEVAAAAKQLRSEISKPIEQRLVDQDLIDSYYTGFENLKREDLEDLVPEEHLEKYFDGMSPFDDINKKLPKEIMDELQRVGRLTKQAKIPKGDKSYFHRQWDFGAIENNPQDFVETIRNALHDVSVDGMRNKETIIESRITTAREKIATRKTEPDWEGAQPRDLATRKTDARNKAKAIEKASNELKNSRIHLDKKLREKVDVPAKDIKKARSRVHAAQKKLIAAQRSKPISLEQKILEMEDDLAIMRVEHDRYISKQLDSDLTIAAQEIKNSVEGGLLKPGYRIKSFEAGPLKDRTFYPPSDKFDKYLVNNAESVWNDYVEQVAPSLHMKERFGSNDLKDELIDVGREYDEAILKADTKLAKKLNKEKEQTIDDLQAMIDSLHNRFKVPDDPSGFLSQGAKRLREFNFVTLLGQMTVSAIPDVGHIIMRHGLRSFTGGLMKVATMSKGLKLSMRQQRVFGMAADLTSNSRAERMAFLDNHHGLTTRSDRAMQKVTSKFSRYTGMQHWNAGWKQFTGFIYSNDIIDDAVKLSKGKLDSKKITQYARGGLSKNDMQSIAKEIDAQKTSKMNGVWIPNPDEWTNPVLAQRFKNALMKEVETTIVTPGVGDLPLVSRGELGRLVFQFKSFAMTANSRIVLASLDDFSAQKMIGLLSMVTLGGISQLTRDATKGKSTDVTSEKGIKQFIDNSIDRSGLLAYWGDVNGMIEKATRGRAHIIPKLSAEPLDRYASRNVLGSILGPSAGRVSDVTQITGAISAGEWRETDARAMRRMMLFNNLFWTHRAFNKVEEAMGGKGYGPAGQEK